MNNKVNIFIYDLPELDSICPKIKLSAEMDLFDLFLNQIKNNYNLVSNIEKSDIAFIPINFVKIIYYYENPPTFGIKYKADIIDFYWKLIENKIVKNNIPHFILYSYVLFELDFSNIPSNIYILSYEKKVTLHNYINTIDNGTNNRMLMIPYILNENNNYGQSKLVNYYFDNYNLPDMLKIKDYDVGFFGTIDCRTSNLFNSRKFLLQFNKNSNFKYINGPGHIAENNMCNIKYIFVLRGDTPTRLCFYQCFAFGCVPILYKKDAMLYSNLILPTHINILDSFVIIPDIDEYDNIEEYNILIEKILINELSNESNYLNKIKNHKLIFDNFNYFGEPLSKPINNIINYLNSKYNVSKNIM